MNKDKFAEIAESITEDKSLDEVIKSRLLRNLQIIKEAKVNILITGATGCGKSSTINALFEDKNERAKVGQGVNPETMNIEKFEYNNIVLFDSPGLGDGSSADIRHSKNIIDKLYEKTNNEDMLIDLVLVILDGSSRDLGTSFELINKVIIPNIGEDKKRLLVAINQADQAMKGRNWNHETNMPEPELVKFLDEKVISTQKRIKEATGVDVEPIYYAAGYKDGNKEQYPYNLSKLLLLILNHTKEEKRAVFIQDINTNEQMWAKNDGLKDYGSEIKQKIRDSFASHGEHILGEIGGFIAGDIGRTAGKFVGRLAGGLLDLIFG
jgi:predicted GTPase